MVKVAGGWSGQKPYNWKVGGGAFYLWEGSLVKQKLMSKGKMLIKNMKALCLVHQ